ncbi:MAG: VanZ family protein [Oxalobacteraceae bacterium]
MLLRRIPLCCLAVFFLSMVAMGSLPGEASALSSRFGDKTLHAAAYALISVLAHQSLVVSRNKRAIISVVLVGGLGLLDESIQHLLPYRNASLMDWCFDMAAAIAVATFFWLLGRGTGTASITSTAKPETPHEKKDVQGRINQCGARHLLFCQRAATGDRESSR